MRPFFAMVSLVLVSGACRFAEPPHDAPRPPPPPVDGYFAPPASATIYRLFEMRSVPYRYDALRRCPDESCTAALYAPGEDSGLGSALRWQINILVEVTPDVLGPHDQPAVIKVYLGRARDRRSVNKVNLELRSFETGRLFPRWVMRAVRERDQITSIGTGALPGLHLGRAYRNERYGRVEMQLYEAAARVRLDANGMLEGVLGGVVTIEELAATRIVRSPGFDYSSMDEWAADIGSPDVDLDDDGRREGYSIAHEFVAAPVGIVDYVDSPSED